MNDIAVRYGKELIVAEVSMGYTMEDYKSYEKLEDSERKGYATRQELVDKIEYPMTVQGQVDFTKDFLNRVAHVADDKSWCGILLVGACLDSGSGKRLGNTGILEVHERSGTMRK